MKKFILGYYAVCWGLRQVVAMTTMRLHCCRSILRPTWFSKFVGGTRTIEVKTDQATWQVESNQTWCKVEKSDGTHFTVTAEENTASEPKPQAVVTVTAGTAQVVLKVDQKGTATPGRNYI